MPRVIFSPAMQRHVKCPPVDVTGANVRDALDAAFAIHPAARSYVLDDQSHVRKHVSIFCDGKMVRDRTRLSEQVTDRSQILIVPALSGG
ncbi:MAG: MoaD/ThiS family protein [Hyphomicrobium sp.]